jgi:methionine sulfoxide reductase catalytic subunit
MNYIVRKPWDLPQRLHTPEGAKRPGRLPRRDFLASVANTIAAAGLMTLATGCNEGTDGEVLSAGKTDPVATVPAENGDDAMAGAGAPPPSEKYPAERDTRFEYGRDETREVEAARYTNFYEFTTFKSAWRNVGKFQPHPWTVEVDGLCSKPQTFDLDDLIRQMPLEERQYRHRCVETWAMCVPWTGFPLHKLIRLVEPQPAARFVAFETFDRPEQAPNRSESGSYPWPYVEGLTLEEATNELTLLATGMYGHPLLKQHGAPIRLVVPWKYGFKSIKSIVKITLTATQPATFWNTIQPQEYDFEANVNPDVPHPRWSQRTEKMLGTGERFATVLYNGYGEFVGNLYGRT